MPMTDSEATKILTAVLGPSHDIPEDLRASIIYNLKKSSVIVRKKIIFFDIVITNLSALIISALKVLYEKPDVFTELTCQLVISSYENSRIVADAIVYLSRFPQLAKMENFFLLKSARQKAQSLAFTMGTLYRLNPQLCQLENFQRLLAIKNTEIRFYGNIFIRLRKILKSGVFNEEMLQELIYARKTIVSIFKAVDLLSTKCSHPITKDLFLVLFRVKNDAEEFAQYLINPPCDTDALNRFLKILANYNVIHQDVYKTYLKISIENRKVIVSALIRLSMAKLYDLENIIILLVNPEYVAMFCDSKHFKFRSLERRLETGVNPDFFGLQAAIGVPIKIQALDLLCRVNEAELELENVAVELPTALDAESAMAKKRVNKAYENLAILFEHYGKLIPTYDDIIKFESQIRRKLLLEIREMAEKNNNSEVLKFLTDANIASLAMKSCIDLSRIASCLLCKRDDPIMITYRAYDSQPVSGSWPDLLSPQGLDFPSEPFCPRTKPVSLPESSRYVRVYAVICYLASIDEKLSIKQRETIWENFKYYIAEIRRAHSKSIYETDKVSCLPGTLSRLSLIASAHPYCEKPTLAIETLVEQRIKFLINRELGIAFYKEETSTDKEALFYSLTMLGIDNALDVIKDENQAYVALVDDSASYITKCLEKRALFISHLKLKDIIDDISGYLKEHNHTFNIYTYFLTIKNLLQMRTLVELSYSQIRSIQGIEEKLEVDVVAEPESKSESESESDPFPPPLYSPKVLAESLARIPMPDEKRDYHIARAIIREYWIPLFMHEEYKIYREYSLTLLATSAASSGMTLQHYLNLINQIIHLSFEKLDTFTTKQQLITYLLNVKASDILEKLSIEYDRLFLLDQVLTTMIKPMYFKYAQHDEYGFKAEIQAALPYKHKERRDA